MNNVPLNNIKWIIYGLMVVGFVLQVILFYRMSNAEICKSKRPSVEDFKFEDVIYSTDTESTGMERPLWGELKVLSLSPSDERYHTMSSLPWCSPPTDQSEECAKRTPKRVEIPYEMDKI